MTTVRAIDVGFGVTKYIRRVAGNEIECAMFPSIAQIGTTDCTGKDGLGLRRQVVSVPFDTVFHEVGPDIELMLGPWRPINQRKGYVEAPEYLAFMRAAMYYMGVDVIDLLVLGLPVADLNEKKARLIQLAEGEHRVGGGRTVLVKRVQVIAQPQGALVTYATDSGAMDRMRNEQSLVLDAGTRTFDWVICRGLRLRTKRSYSVDFGMHDVLKAIAREIAIETGSPFSDFESIDRSLRKVGPLKLYGKVYSLDKYKRVISGMVDQALGEMLSQIGDVQRFENIVLAGGGAFLFRKRIKELFAKQAVVEVEDPIFANVRGFQLAGQGQAEAESTRDPVASMELGQ